MTLAGQRVLVTGASGFIGSHLCRRLISEGAEVHGISRQKTEGGLARWWQADVANAEATARIVSTVRPAVIFHLASHVVGYRNLEAVLPTFHSNLASTISVMTAAAKNGCSRVVLTGSLEEPEFGDAQAVPCSPYAAAKWASNAYARMFHALYQLPVIVLRVFMVYGPAQRDIKKLIPYVILCLLRGEQPKLSSGVRPVDWIYVNDVAEAFVAAAESQSAVAQTVDVGSGQLVSVRSVVERLADILGSKTKPAFGAVADRPMEQVRVADINRSQELIGWQPSTSLETGLKKTVEWYAEQLKRGAFA